MKSWLDLAWRLVALVVLLAVAVALSVVRIPL